MNAKALAIIIVAASAACNVAAADTSLSTVAVRGDARVIVNCRDERLPSRQLVGELLESNNASYVTLQREFLVRTAHRECMRGADNVAFLRDTSTMPASLALASSGK